MLGKLFFHEMRSTWKLMGLILAAMGLVTVLMVLWNKVLQPLAFYQEMVVLSSSLTLLFNLFYLFVLAAAAFGTVVLLLLRFYRNVYGDEGYLTNTLPVSVHEIICSKLMAAWIWSVLNTAIIAFSLLIVFFFLLEGDLPADFAGGMKEIGTSAFDGNLWLPVLLVVNFLLDVLSRFLQIYAAISLGHLSAKHRVIMSVLSYFLLRLISQMLSSIVMTVYSLARFRSPMLMEEAIMGPVFGEYLLAGLLVSIPFGVVCYLITAHIMKNRLNLA